MWRLSTRHFMRGLGKYWLEEVDEGGEREVGVETGGG